MVTTEDRINTALVHLEHGDVARAMAIVRDINPKIKTVQQCRHQLSVWKNDAAMSKVRNDATDDIRPVEAEVARLLRDRVVLFDENMLRLIQLLGNCGVEIVPSLGDEGLACNKGLLTVVVQSLIMLITRNVNPTVTITSIIEELSRICLNNAGECVREPYKAVSEACDNVSEKIKNSNITHDIMRVV